MSGSRGVSQDELLLCKDPVNKPVPIGYLSAVLLLSIAFFESPCALSAQDSIQNSEGSAAALAPVVPQQVRYAGKLDTR